MIYYILYIPFILCGFVDTSKMLQRTKRNIIYFWVFILTLFLGLRWKCGTDWQNYYDIYYGSHFSNIFTFDRGHNEPLESGFVFINAIFNDLGFHYTFFLLLTSFVILLSFARFSLIYSKFPIMTFVYIVLSTGCFNFSRQTLTAAIILMGFKYVLSDSVRSKVKYIILVLIASTIHTSTIFGLLIMFLPKIRFKIKNLIIISLIVSMIVLYLSNIIEYILLQTTQIPIIYSRFYAYVNSVSSMGDDFSQRGLLSLVMTAFFFVSFLICKYYNDEKDKLRIFFNGYVIQEGIRLLFANTMRDFMRLELFLHPFSAAITCNFLGNGYSKRFRIIWRLFYLFLMIYFFERMLHGVFSDAYLPYRSILTE